MTEPSSGDTIPLDSNELEGVERARPHHYRFAYNVLPQFVYFDPAKFKQVAESGDMTQLLRSLWDKVGLEFSDDQRLPSDELIAAVDEFDEITRVIVIMPKPEKPMECIFVGFAIYVPPKNLLSFIFKKAPSVWIYSLETSYPFEGKSISMLGQLSKQGRTGNLGTGPIDFDGFKLWIAQHIRQSRH